MQYHRDAIFFTVDLHIKEIEGLLVYGTKNRNFELELHGEYHV